MSGADGKAGAVGALVSDAARAVDELRAASDGEQVAMFTLPTRHTGARARELQRAIEARRTAGRPPGAVNKSTKALRDYLLARGKHPLQSLMEWSLHTPTSLAAELQCSRLEAARFLKDLWAELTPYFSAKLQPTDADGKPVPMFGMIVGGQNVQVMTAVPPWERAPGLPGEAEEETQQNQGLADAPKA